MGALAEAAYRAAGHLDDDVGYDAVLRDAAGRADPGPLLVAEDAAGRLVGTATVVTPGTEHAEIGVAGETEFRFLAVAPWAQRRGVARALVDAVRDHARAGGSRRVVCCVVAWNDAAHRLYLDYGFRRAPERDWTPVPGIELWAYELEL